jgi:hypothetical protein
MYPRQQGTCEAGATVVFVIEVAECYRPFWPGRRDDGDLVGAK